MKPLKLDVEVGDVRIAVGIPNLDAIPALDLRLGHVSGHRVLPIARQSIHTGPHQKMGAALFLLCRRAHKCRFRGRRYARTAPDLPALRWTASGSAAVCSPCALSERALG